MADGMTPTEAWVRCICGYARGRADVSREDCPVCGPALDEARHVGREMSGLFRG